MADTEHKHVWLGMGADRRCSCGQAMTPPPAADALAAAMLSVDYRIEVHMPNSIGLLTGSDNDAGRDDYAAALLAALAAAGFEVVPQGLRAALRYEDVRKAITDSYYDTRNEGGTMEKAADLAATRVMNLQSQALTAAPAAPEGAEE